MADTQEKTPKAEPKAAPGLAEQQAELNAQAFNIEVARRTGLPLDKAAKVVERLREKGDFFDENGRWTLDAAGYPVNFPDWKEAKPAELP